MIITINVSLYLQELTFLIPIGQITGALNFNSYVWAIMFDNQIITGWWLDHLNMPVEDLINSQLQSEEEFTDQCSSDFKLQYSGKFQITVEKNLSQGLTCRLPQLRLGLKLFHMVERKMYHSQQTFEISYHL